MDVRVLGEVFVRFLTHNIVHVSKNIEPCNGIVHGTDNFHFGRKSGWSNGVRQPRRLRCCSRTFYSGRTRYDFPVYCSNSRKWEVSRTCKNRVPPSTREFKHIEKYLQIVPWNTWVDLDLFDPIDHPWESPTSISLLKFNPFDRESSLDIRQHFIHQVIRHGRGDNVTVCSFSNCLWP